MGNPQGIPQATGTTPIEARRGKDGIPIVSHRHYPDRNRIRGADRFIVFEHPAEKRDERFCLVHVRGVVDSELLRLTLQVVEDGGPYFERTDDFNTLRVSGATGNEVCELISRTLERESRG